MSEKNQPEIGSIIRGDLTDEQAEELREFYAEVAGWENDPVEMGGYQDFNVCSYDGESAHGGIDTRRGMNADLTPLRLAYIAIADLLESIQRREELDGRLVSGPKGEAKTGRYCDIQDPSGVVAAL